MRARILAVLPIVLALAVPLRAQVVHGRLVDQGSGAPIAGGRVQLLRGGQAADTAVTDSAGVFTLRGEEGGRFRLSAERVGYATSVSPEVEFAEDDSVEVLFRIAAATVVLDPLEVVATSRRRGPWIEAFYERAEKRRFGRFFTREQIERRRAMHVTDILRSSTGLHIVPARRIGYVVLGRGGCTPVVLIDGTRLSYSGNTLDEWVRPEELEGIEVYAGSGQAPGEYARYENGCAMILLWTRSGK